MLPHGADSSRAWLARAALTGIVAIGLALRLYGIDWDQNHLLHPDERQILLVADAMRTRAERMDAPLLSPGSPLNPGFFAYGSITFYLIRLATDGFSWAARAIPALAEWDDLTELNQLRLVGRSISALADAATILLTYLLARRLSRREVGLVASALVAGSVIHVQLSHFYTADTLMIPLCLAALLLLIRTSDGGSRAWPVAAGVAIGLALAVKLSAAPLVAVAAVALSLRHARWAGEDLARPAVALAGGAVVTFIATQPFVVLDWQAFLRDVLTQAAIIGGRRDTVYTRQFIGRLPIIYQAWNLALFGIGLPLAVAALLGLGAAVRRAWRGRSPAEIICLAWVLACLLVIGIGHAKFLRYLLPIVPVLCVYAAMLLVDAPGRRDGTTSARAAGRAARWALVAAVVGTTGLYALAHDSIYSRPHTAIDASRWLYEHAPSGSAIVIEHWDEPLPLPLDDEGVFVSAQTQSYRQLTLPMYDPDGDAKLQLVAEALAEADFIALYSNRLYGSIARLPERYPLTSAYYRLLFREEIGFELVHVSASYPDVLGMALVDDTLGEAGLAEPALLSRARGARWIDLGHADESYTVYDHPAVLVFRKSRQVSADEVRRAIQSEDESYRNTAH